jgi:hypothetical protein
VTSGSLSIQDAGKALRKACRRARCSKGGASSCWDLRLVAIFHDAPKRRPMRLSARARRGYPGKFAGRPNMYGLVLPGCCTGA